MDLESHSSLLRTPSVAGDHEALSDGYLSDSAVDEGKDKNKKKKPWKVRVNPLAAFSSILIPVVRPGTPGNAFQQIRREFRVVWVLMQ